MLYLRHILALLIGITVTFSLPVDASADHSAKESNIKAAILYNLARFSQWSEDHVLMDEKFNVCTLSNTDMNHALDDLSGKSIHGRKIDVIHLQDYAEVTQDCQVLYVSEAYMSENDTTEMLDLSEITQKGILTVGETPDFLESGGCISIQRRGKKLRFSINKQAMDAANIKPSSKILQLSVNPRP